jgi:hypothetical protein
VTLENPDSQARSSKGHTLWHCTLLLHQDLPLVNELLRMDVGSVTYFRARVGTIDARELSYQSLVILSLNVLDIAHYMNNIKRLQAFDQ